MIERAELCRHRNSTLKAGVMPWSFSAIGGSRRAMSPHSSGRPPQQVSVRKASNWRMPATRTAWMICLPWRVAWVRPARSRAARWKEVVEGGEAEAGGEVAGGEAGGAGRHEQADQAQPGFHREGGEGRGGFQ
jgi:hypothetical protein